MRHLEEDERPLNRFSSPQKKFTQDLLEEIPGVRKGCPDSSEDPQAPSRIWAPDSVDLFLTLGLRHNREVQVSANILALSILGLFVAMLIGNPTRLS